MVENHHDDCVSRWFGQAADRSSVEPFLHAFEQAFAALWQRAHLTLGSVTLTAIVDRVICNAAERCPMLSALTVDETGLRCQQLREQASGCRQEDLERGARFVLVEFLTILGRLTAGVLSPALHAELERMAWARGGRARKPGAVAAKQATRNGLSKGTE